MYDSDRFYQACAIPYRVKDDGTIEFCLITSRKSGKWSLPKGTIRSEETVTDTITRQANKEAGIRGELFDNPVGAYTYSKWETLLEVVVLLMKVRECDEEWPDMKMRKRCWASAAEAIELLAREDHKKLVEKAVERIESS